MTQDNDNEAVTTILLISIKDDPRRALADALKAQGYNLLIADNGREGLRLWREHREIIDLFILDHNLGDLNYRRVLQVLSGAQEKLKIILAATKEIFELNHQFYSRDRSQNVKIIKPYANMAEVIRFIQSVLEQK